MLSSKEAKRIMPKAERKSRKWGNKHRFYELLASQAEQYIRKYDGRDAESIELNVFLRHSYGVFKELEEKSYEKMNKWHELYIEEEQERKEKLEQEQRKEEGSEQLGIVLKGVLAKKYKKLLQWAREALCGCSDEEERLAWGVVITSLKNTIADGWVAPYLFIDEDSRAQQLYGKLLCRYNDECVDEEDEEEAELTDEEKREFANNYRTPEEILGPNWVEILHKYMYKLVEYAKERIDREQEAKTHNEKLRIALSNVHEALKMSLKSHFLPEFGYFTEEYKVYSILIYDLACTLMDEKLRCTYEMVLNHLEAMVLDTEEEKEALKRVIQTVKNGLKEGIRPVFPEKTELNIFLSALNYIDQLQRDARHKPLIAMPWYKGLSDEEIRDRNATCLKRHIAFMLDICAEEDKEAWQSLMDKCDKDLDVTDLTPREFKVYCWIWFEENEERKKQLQKEPQYKVEMIEED